MEKGNSIRPGPRRTSTRALTLAFTVASLTLTGVSSSAGQETEPSRVHAPAVGADARPPDAAADVGEETGTDDYDPWQPFNERMFWFNHDVLDRFALKPVATGWDTIVPDPAKRGLGRAFDNLEMPRRLVNHLLQARPVAAGRELARFVLNTTVGVVGFLDVATPLGIEKSDADTGQTLGVYGVGAGPYLVLPLLPPMTLRDGIGYGIDGALDPLGYVLPGLANGARSVVNTVNERARNLAVFQDVEESVLDLYSAVRNGYLQRRQRAIAERRSAVQ